jgi:DNA modification methylase
MVGVTSLAGTKLYTIKPLSYYAACTNKTSVFFQSDRRCDMRCDKIMTGEGIMIDNISQQLLTLETIDWAFSDAKTTYLTHGLHPYPAKYIPQIPHALINALSYTQETVADIFCGSGTTLVESMMLGRNTIGIDANPLACLISEAKTTRFVEGDEEVLCSLVKRAQVLADEVSVRGEQSLFGSETFHSQASRPDHKAISFWFELFVVEELAEILSWCQSLPSTTSRNVALTAFSSIIVVVSKQDSDTRYVRRQKNILPGDTFRRFGRSLKDAIQAVVALNKEIASDLHCDIYHNSILTPPNVGYMDLVVCSPPYPNAYSYHLYHMTRMIWLGMNQPKFKQEEIGSHRKYSKKGPLEEKIETFRREMITIFNWMHEYLRPERYACFVVGDSTIQGQRISTVDIIVEAARDCHFREVGRLHRRMMDTKKAFNPVIGKIKGEHILILQKDSRKTI